MKDEKPKDRVRLNGVTFRNSLLLGLTFIAAVATVSVAQYPKFLFQQGALLYVFELAGILAAYALLIFLVARPEGLLWNAIRRNAVLFGLITGVIEIFNILIENFAATVAHTPTYAVGFMTAVFISWGVAAAWVTRMYKVRWAGVLTAISSAGICMIVAVSAGFLIEFFVAHPDLSNVATWAEYKRSGWTDVRAFSIANTLDSGFTHLLLALIVAAIFGGIGTFLIRPRREFP